MLIRQSGIQQWAKCPESFRLKYVVGLKGRQSAAASYGTILHFALQTYYLNNFDIILAKRTFEHYWDHPEYMECTPDYYLPRTSWSQYKSQGLAALDEYHLGKKWDDDIVIGLEVPFTVPVGDHKLTGTIDLLRIRKNKKGIECLDIADFKTGKRPYFLRYNVQFTAYNYASFKKDFWEGIEGGDEWAERVEGLPRSHTWIDLKSLPFNEIDAGEREPADHVRLEKTIEAMAKSVEEEIYVPTLTGDACAYCDFYKECGLPAGNLASGDLVLDDSKDISSW